jgi:hypothetical protein
MIVKVHLHQAALVAAAKVIQVRQTDHQTQVVVAVVKGQVLMAEQVLHQVVRVLLYSGINLLHKKVLVVQLQVLVDITITPLLVTEHSQLNRK